MKFPELSGKHKQIWTLRDFVRYIRDQKLDREEMITDIIQYLLISNYIELIEYSIMFS